MKWVARDSIWAWVPNEDYAYPENRNINQDKLVSDELYDRLETILDEFNEVCGEITRFHHNGSTS